MTQFDPLNPIRIPQHIYGQSGVSTGRILYQAARPHGFSMMYSLASRKITVLNSATFEPAALRAIIFSDATRHLYNGWYPEVDDARDGSGNLQIRLTPQRPVDFARRRLDFTALELEVEREIQPQIEVERNNLPLPDLDNYYDANPRTTALHSLMTALLRDVSGKPPMQRALDQKNVSKIQELLFQNAPNPGQFDTLCREFPEIAARAIILYPELAKTVSSVLFCHLCQSPISEALAIKLIEAGVDVGRVALAEQTALHVAVERSGFYLIQKLLQAGANAYAKNSFKRSPLDLAREKGNGAILDLLKEYYLSYALQSDNRLRVQELLELKAPLTQEEGLALWQKFPDLSMRAVGNYPQVATFCPFAVIHRLCSQAPDGTLKISVLVASGAEVLPQEFLLLCREFPEVMVQVVADNPKLAKNCPPQVLDGLYTSPNSEEILLKLFDLGAEVRPKHLALAIRYNFIELTVNLLSLKIDVSHAVGDDLKPPLLLAVDANHDFLVELLIEAKAAVNVQDAHGTTALHVAANKGNQAIVHMLLQAGANVLVKNALGFSPRDLAIQSGNAEIAKLLFEKSLPEAITGGDKKLVTELLLQNAPLSDESFLALCFEFPDLALEVMERTIEYSKKFPQIELFNLVIYEKCEPLLVKFIELFEGFRTVKTSENKTLLHFTLEHKRIQAAAKLIDVGADIFARTKHGQTALHLAAKGGFLAIVERLLKAGAKASDTDNFGCQPLHVAATCLNISVLEKLLEAGADPFYADINGNTPLTLALNSGHFDVAKVLLRTMPKPLVDKVTLQKSHKVAAHLQTLAEANPELARNSCTPTSTPFELALLLGDRKLLLTFMRQLTEQQCLAGVEVLLTKYPHSCSTIVDFLFQIDNQHLAFGSLSRMDAGPPAIKQANLDDILARFTAVSAGQDEQTANAVGYFLTQVKNEVYFTGTPQPGTPAFKEQYALVRDAITHVLLHLQKSENEPGYNAKVLDVCKELALAAYACFIQYRATALMLYNKYCLQVAPTAENAILQQLQELRGILVEGMTSEEYVSQPQSVHAVQYFKRVLGKSLQLADQALFAEELPFDGSGFKNYQIPPVEQVSYSFFTRYRPSVVFDYITGSLADERMRSLYLTWAKVHMKTSVPGRDEYKAKKAALQQKQNELITKMLKSDVPPAADEYMQYKQQLVELAQQLAVEPPYNSTYVESAKADMLHAANSWLLDEVSLAAKPFPILLMLIQQKVLKFRDDVKK